MNQYLILLKGKKELDYSPSQLQKRLEAYRQWVSTIEEHYVSDNRLERRGVHISTKDTLITDGPFLETKEIIAGFVILKAENLEQATQLANGSPLLDYFELIVRPIIAKD